MPRSLLRIAALACLAGCGPLSEERYAERATEAQCDWLVSCHPHLYAGVDACLAELGTSFTDDDADCPYDGAAARSCVAGLEERACPVDGEFPVYPEACAHVRDCGSADESGPGGSDA